jgi:hypothetical protein
MPVDGQIINAQFLQAIETIDLTKKNVKNKNCRELYVLHFL